MAGLLSTEYVLALFAVEIYCAAQQRVLRGLTWVFTSKSIFQNNPDMMMAIYEVWNKHVVFCTFSEEATEDGEKSPRSSSRMGPNATNRDVTDSRRTERKSAITPKVEEPYVLGFFPSNCSSLLCASDKVLMCLTCECCWLASMWPALIVSIWQKERQTGKRRREKEKRERKGKG